MAGYNDTRDLIISALMGRPAGTEIQPENHQAYALNMLDYIRSVELVSTSILIGLAEENTVPIQPNDSRVCYIAGIGQDRTVVFNNFIDNTGNPISITTGEMEGVFVILLWNTEHWVAYTFPTNIISSAELANFYYSYNIRKTYESVTAMNADSTNPVGTDGRLIKIGDLVTVVNTTTPSENGFYSRTVNGWQLQSGFNFQVENVRSQSVNNAPSSKLLDDELNKIIEDLTTLGTVGMNKLNPFNYSQDKYIKSDGTLGTSASWKTTDFQPMFDVVSFRTNNISPYKVSYIAQYDANYNFISDSYQTNVSTISRAPEAVYYRLSTVIEPSLIMAVSGSIVGIAFEKYALFVDSNIGGIPSVFKSDIKDSEKLKTWLLGECFLPISNVVYDFNGALKSADVVYPDEKTGTITITRNVLGSAITVIATYNSMTAILTISRDLEDKVINATITFY